MTYRGCISYMLEKESVLVPQWQWCEVEARGAMEARNAIREIARNYRWRGKDGEQFLGRVLSVGAIRRET